VRLLILTGEFAPFRGGIATYARELALAGHEAGHEVTVAAPDYGADQRDVDAAWPFRVERYRGGVPDMKGLPGRILAARRIAASGRFDVVHAADWPFFIPVRLLGRRRAPRRVLTLHGTEVIYMQAPRRRRLLDLLGFWRRGWATWISNSRFTHESALAAFPIAPEDARAVPLGVSRSWFDGHLPRGEARAALGLADEVVLVSLGRLVPRKGHLVLAEALAGLPAELAARVRWWVIGPPVDEAFAAALRERIGTLRVETHLFGPLPDAEVKQRLSAADLFCLPGYRGEAGEVEGFGLVFLEAAAYGVPAIATRSGGIGEAVEDGVTGLLVPERDAEALTGALATMIRDDAGRARMAEAARRRAAGATWARVFADTFGPA
jgi:phosphatidyl-myo-inositol dimannoside synthase